MIFENYLKKFLILLLIIQTSLSFSQSLLSLSNYSQVKVSTLSDADIDKLKQEMQKRNLSISDIENIALSKGMSPSDISILKQRLMQNTLQTNIGTNSNSISSNVTDTLAKVVLYNNPKIVAINDSTIFGSEIFSNPSLSFEPNSSIATPANYILGPMDELQIVIYGVQQYSETVKINKEGLVTLSNIGQLKLGGQTFSAAEVLIKKAASKIYNTLQTGEAHLSVSLTNIKTINVTIIGAKVPGNYSLSSLSTVFNALHIAGGPNDNGSYRKIELVRANKVVRVIDIYRFLMTGDQSDNINLQDNDVIRIPVYEKRVRIKGSVKRPGIFELKGSENFNDLLKYCDGFKDDAFTGSVKLYRNTAQEQKIIDVTQKEYSSTIAQSGDVYVVSEILNRFENRVSVKGAVLRSGEYALKDSMTLKELIAIAGGLTEDAFLDHALLIREKEDRVKEAVGVDLNLAMIDNPVHNKILRKEDELIISSKLEFQEKFMVSIFGEVQSPGDYPYINNLTLYDLIIRAGGLKESSSKKVEIARVIKKDTIILGSTSSSEILNIELSGNMRDQSKNVLLQPNDIIQIRKMPTYEKTMPVYITGEVYYPGEYIIGKKQERILSIIERAGGLSEEAYEGGIKVLRKSDNLLTQQNDKNEVTIPIDYKSIKKHPKSRKNIRVREGDQIIVSKISNIVKVIGQVALNSEIPMRKRRSVRYYVNSVGGYTDSANAKKVFVVYANGMAKKTQNYILFKDYPQIERGCQIVVPKKPVREGVKTTDIVAMSGIISSIATMAVVIYKILQP